MDSVATLVSAVTQVAILGALIVFVRPLVRRIQSWRERQRAQHERRTAILVAAAEEEYRQALAEDASASTPAKPSP